MSNLLKVLGGLLALTCLLLFGVVGVPLDNGAPTIALYLAVGLAGAGALWLGDRLDP